MIRIGKLIIANENEVRDIVTTAMPETIARRSAEAINQDLLRACMAADAHLHEDPANPAHELHRQAVCDMLVAAIGPAITGR